MMIWEFKQVKLRIFLIVFNMMMSYRLLVDHAGSAAQSPINFLIQLRSGNDTPISEGSATLIYYIDKFCIIRGFDHFHFDLL